ncbi:E3 ubiquitin-protein ligase Ubr3-like, partial [Nilaparvata lugens]|uniref:E3 ubiquitin-protein ligase Ubr3-like n=1 Tax=Nilaparvata lugens TaxID=108931 RepID=UPI00193E558C
ENVIAVRERLWPRQPEEGEAERREREERERGERRRRAKERQQKLMEEFASQQKQFMERTLETEDDGMDWEAGEENSQMLSNKKEYDCVICNQTSPSTDEKLMGLAVLVQATSVLGHKRRSSEPAVLPTSDQERANFSRNDTLGSDFDRRIEEIDRHFDKLSWLVSVNLGWEGGVHVQTCGHHLHLDCLKSYLRSLMGQQRFRLKGVNTRVHYAVNWPTQFYLCPLSWVIVPLWSDLGLPLSQPASLSSPTSSRTSACHQTTSSLMIAMSKLMEDMTNSTYLKCKQEIFGNCNPQMLFLFVSSVARTNLEIELVQRGGSLCSLSSMDQSLIPKRSCIMPLLHVLAEHAKKLAQWPAWETWQQLAGCASQDDTAPALIPAEPPMPLMLRDPTALLIHFILLLPLHLDQ